MKINDKNARIGLGSYCYRYNAGFQGFRPQKPMTVEELLQQAHRLGYQGIQLCENMNYSSLDKKRLLAIEEKARELGIFIEVGMNDLSVSNISRHLDIVELLSSGYLRVVLGATKIRPEEDREGFRENAKRTLMGALPRIKALGITVGVENHFDLPSPDLVRLIEEIDDRSVGLIFDSTNCLGFIESPEDVLETFGPHLVGIHIKDYDISKIAGGYRIAGVPLGEGLQDVAGMLEKAVEYNPSMSIILEMPVHDEPGLSMEDIMAWEKKAVEISTEYLFKVVKRLNLGFCRGE